MYEIFVKLCERNGVKPAQVSKETGIAQPTFTAWKKGEYTPKRDKLQLIAEYFGVSLEYLTTGKDTPKESTSGATYYFSDETAQAAQNLLENRDLRALMDAAQDSTPEEIRLATEMLIRFKGTNPDG